MTKSCNDKVHIEFKPDANYKYDKKVIQELLNQMVIDLEEISRLNKLIDSCENSNIQMLNIMMKYITPLYVLKTLE